MNETRPAEPIRILLVDDNAHGNEARKAVLAEYGYAVECATSGEQGLEMFLAEPFQIVITDLKMERMSGIDLIAQVRATGRKSLLILLSGFAGCLGITEESSGADAVLCKSHREQEELLRTIRELMARETRRKPATRSAGRSTMARSG